MKIFRAVQAGMEIPEDLSQLELYDADGDGKPEAVRIKGSFPVPEPADAAEEKSENKEEILLPAGE